jgi:hypothetical protein
MKPTVLPAGERCQSRRIVARLLLVAVFLAGAGCVSDGAGPETLRVYFDAVQSEDFDRLYCMMAGASESAELGATDAERRAGFEAWARAYYDAYETGRDEGWVELDEQGLALVKLFSLGRGTFVTEQRSRRLGPDTRAIESRIRFGYAHIDLSPFSPGTTFYVCGAPVGRVHPVRVPVGSAEVEVEALEAVTVEWTLVRRPADENCPAGWAVASGRPVEGSSSTREITWVF